MISPYLTPHTPQLARGEDWRARAACRNEDPELFYPADTDAPENRTQARIAKQVCYDCPVLQECRDWVMPRNEFGIIAGLTAKERQGYRKSGITPPLKPEPKVRAKAEVVREHGTTRGYGQHQHLHEVACQDCLTAIAMFRRAQRRRDAS